jgi:outer membrane protein
MRSQQEFRRARAIEAALLASCAVGCRAVHEAHRAQDPATAVLGERAATVAEIGLESSGPVALDTLVGLALKVNPTVVKSRFDAQAAEARVSEAESAKLPQVSTDASVTYSDHQNASTQNHFTSLGFSLSWLLFDFGRNDALAHSAAENWLAAQHDVRSAEVDSAFGVRSAYFGLVKQQDLVVVATETVQQFQKRLDQVNGFVAAGTRIRYDATKAEVDLENARLIEVQARDAELVAQAVLAHAIGLQEVVDWTPDPDAALPALPETFDAAWQIAQQNEPSLAAAAAREQAASALVDARIAALYPSLGLAGGANESGTDFPLAWGWSLGGALTWVPFDGFERISTIDESAASLRSARTAHTLAEQLVWLDVRTSWLAIEDARRRIDLTTLAVQSAEENLVLAQARFDVGKGTSVELTDAQQALAQARGDLVDARADERVARARLAKSLGIVEAKE